MWTLMLLAAAIQTGAEQEESFYELRRRVFDDAAERLARAARAYARRSEGEVAQLGFGLASMFARTPEEFEREGAQAAPGFRTDPVALLDACREARLGVRRLARLGEELDIRRERAGLEALDAMLEQAGPALSLLRRLNDARAAARLPLAGYSGRLSFACALHARYMALEKDFGSTERRASPYRTEEGAAAGRIALLSGAPNPEDAANEWLAGLYRRVPLLHPGLARVGIGLWPLPGRRYVVLDASTDADAGADGIVLYPVAGQRGVPCELRRDHPNPLPREARTGGVPVTLSFFGAHLREAGEVRARLEDAYGREVPCHLSTPARPANDRVRDNAGTVCLIPKEPLRRQSLYRAVFEARLRDGPRRVETYFFTEE